MQKKIYAKKGPFFGGIRMCCTLWLSTPVPPKGYSSTPGVPQGVPTQGKHMGDRDNAIGDRHSAIRAPRSGRLLLRRDLIFELVNTVVNEVRKRAFSAPQLIWSAGGRDAASAKKWRGVHPSILTVHRTVNTRRTDLPSI